MPQVQQRKKTLLDFYSKKSRNTANENETEESIEEATCSSNTYNVNTEEPDELEEPYQMLKQADHREEPHQLVEEADQIEEPLQMVEESRADTATTILPPNYSNAEKLRMPKNIAMPDQTFKFPITVTNHRNLRFQYRWLIRFKWLAYSQSENGAFCKYCVLFGSKAGTGVGNQPLGALSAVKFQRWKHALERFVDHENTKYHHDSVVAAETATAILFGQQESIAIQLDHQRKQQILDNRRKIAPIVETIILCGRQGIPFRGHRVSGPLNLETEENNENEGNFRALLRYRGKYDEVFKKDFASAGHNAQYISPRIQNEIISVCNELILERLVDSINRSRFFSVLADETTDVSCQEQLSLCARYLNDDFAIEECFLQFVPITDLSGKNLVSTIITKLSQFGINVSKMRGQGYDGAAAMSGKLNGAQAHIREIIPTALYVHCAAHSLNLAVSNSCDLPPIRNCMGTIASVYNFFNAPKRQNVLRSTITTILPTTESHRLVQVCATRWVDRHESVSVFSNLQHAVVEALGEISTWPDKETSSRAL